MSDTVLVAIVNTLGLIILAFMQYKYGKVLNKVHDQTNSMHLELMKGAYKQGGDDERANPSAPAAAPR